MDFKTPNKDVTALKQMDGAEISVDYWGEKYGNDGRQYFVTLPRLIFHDDTSLESFAKEFCELIQKTDGAHIIRELKP